VSDKPSNADVISQLERLLGGAGTTADTKATVRRILDRLKNPVRTLIIGCSGSGKTEVLNVLVGKTVVPGGSFHPEFELSWSPQPQTEFTRRDTVRVMAHGNKLANPGFTNVKNVKLGLSLPILKQTSFHEVTCDGTPEDQIAILLKAVELADIVLWCSSEFSEDEQLLWSYVPDTIKDHSFLVLTKADLLSAQKQLHVTMQNLEAVVAEEFCSMIPVAALQAKSATRVDGSIDETVFKASGGKALTEAVFKQATQGRQADSDNALIFLRQHSGQLISTDTKLRDSQHKTVFADKHSLSPDENAENSTDNGVDLFAPVVEHLQIRAAELSQAINDDPNMDAASILAHCLDTANHLAAVFADVSDTSSVVAALENCVLDAVDLIVLMQSENEDDAVADAVTVLLQLKREFEASIAA